MVACTVPLLRTMRLEPHHAENVSNLRPGTEWCTSGSALSLEADALVCSGSGA